MSQSLPFGPTAPKYNGYYLPNCSYEVATTASDVQLNTIFNAGCANSFYCSTAGTVYVQPAGASAMVKYIVLAGERVEICFSALGGTTTGTTPATVVVEV